MASVVRGGALRLAECPCDLRLSRNFRSFPPRSFTCRCYADADVVVLGARLSRRRGGPPRGVSAAGGGGRGASVSAAWGEPLSAHSFSFPVFPRLFFCVCFLQVSVSVRLALLKKKSLGTLLGSH